MPDPIRKVLKELIQARGMTMKEVSLAAQKNHAYIQQYISTGKPEKLDEDTRRMIAAYLQVDEDMLKTPPKGGSVTPTGARMTTPSAKGPSEALFARALSPVGRRDLPLRGRALGGDAETIMLSNDGNVTGYVDRPEALIGDLEAFAVQIVTPSMEPRYFPGEVLKIAAAKIPVLGDFVLIEMLDGTAIVKRWARQTAEEFLVEQYNPPKVFGIPKNKVKRLYLIWGNEHR
jgi:transcriptional regulator with XRE-family HTH domain